MFMREKVSPIRFQPPPGKYRGPLKVKMLSNTPGVEIIFTLDGTIPVRNSDREHGYRCEHYNPYLGYTIREAGRHVFTILGMKKGLVTTPVQRVEYIISGVPERRKEPSLPDKILERRFHAMEQLDPPMPVRLARSRHKTVGCYLIDTSSKDMLYEKIKSGEHVALFRLKHEDTARGAGEYQRVVAPNLDISIPELPSAPSKAISSPAFDRNSDIRRCFTPSFYEKVTFSKNNDSFLTLNTRPNSTPPAMNKSSQNHRTNVALAIFEHRTGLDNPQQNTDYYDDKSDIADMQKYQKTHAEICQKEIDRVSNSVMLARNLEKVIPIADDGASGDNAILALLVLAEAICHDSDFISFLGKTTYQALFSKLAGAQPNDNVPIFDILSVCSGLEQREAVSMLKPFLVESLAEPPMYSPFRLLMIARFVINTAAGIPDAIIGLLATYWHWVAESTKSEPMVGRVALQAILDFYKHVDNFNPNIAAFFSDALSQSKGGLKWSDDVKESKVLWKGLLRARTSAMTLMANLRDKYSEVDHQILLMDDISLPMYSKPLVLS